MTDATLTPASPAPRAGGLLVLPSLLVERLARRRRRWYARHPEKQRRLVRPVLSVGNLTVGGAGKTPIVAHLAGRLLAMGERPAILSRGYARRDRADGVVVVSDGSRILADLDRAGDEPLMLARALPGVGVFVCEDRYLAGCLAERRFRATVHVLDDGFQHLGLHRDTDIVLVEPGDLEDERVLPAGRLREPAEAIDAAQAVLVTGSDEDAARVAGRVRDVPVFRVARRIEDARMLMDPSCTASASEGMDVLAFAGIARPDRFFGALGANGWRVVETIAFRDHHRYTNADVTRIRAAMGECGARLALTTEKDATRLLPLRTAGLPVAFVPLVATVEPREVFGAWLGERLEEGSRLRA